MELVAGAAAAGDDGTLADTAAGDTMEDVDAATGVAAGGDMGATFGGGVCTLMVMLSRGAADFAGGLFPIPPTPEDLRG